MSNTRTSFLAILATRSLKRQVLLAIARGRRSRVSLGDIDTLAVMDAHVAAHNAVLAELEAMRQEVLGQEPDQIDYNHV
jgi:hypothetical protein